MNIRLIQSGGRSALFRAFMIPSGFSSPATLWHITSHYFLLNLPIEPIWGKTRHICCSPEVEFERYNGYGKKAIGVVFHLFTSVVLFSFPRVFINLLTSRELIDILGIGSDSFLLKNPIIDFLYSIKSSLFAGDVYIPNVCCVYVAISLTFCLIFVIKQRIKPHR